MKKLLLILLCLPLLFNACKKTECQCGDIINSGQEDVQSGGLYYLVVENECTDNSETIYVSYEVYYYYSDKKRYCTGAW